MATGAAEVPDISETDLERADLEEAAADLGIEVPDDIDDQSLLERIGVELGAVDEDAAATSAGDRSPDEAQDQADAAQDEAQDQADAAQDEAQDRANDATDEAQDQAHDATDEAQDRAHDATDEAQDEADDADGEDRSPVHEDGEYRFEDDPREGVEPVLDLELGPLALDVLGIEVHLRRVHASLTANPNGKRNVVGKLLAGVARIADRSEDEDEDQDDGDGAGGSADGEEGGLLQKATSPVRRLGRGVKNLVTGDD